MNIKRLALLFAASILLMSCNSEDGNESSGAETKTETDCFRLMKDIGMNAIRLRVWVNPQSTDGYGRAYCGKDDVVKKAVRAHKLDMDIMIDFHYSDRFADPGAQIKPASWKGKTLEELKEAITAHTTEILSALKEKGISPKWIQAGNEINSGMLWDEDESKSGATWNGGIAKSPSGTALFTFHTKSGKDDFSNLAECINAGYDAVKEIFPDAQVIVHLANGHDFDNLNWVLSGLKTNGARYDMIGLSHYPQDSSEKSWQEMNSLAIQNITHLHKTYGKPVMICETGIKSDADSDEAARALSDFMDEIKNLDGCSGVFYWEPQVYGGWKPSVYSKWNWSAYSMGAFTQDGKPGACLEAFSILPDSLAKEADISWITEMEADGIKFYEK